MRLKKCKPARMPAKTPIHNAFKTTFAMSEKEKKKPTETELEILQVLWQAGRPISVREVHERLQSKRSTGYTTTLKLMQIMAEKGLVWRDTSRRTHLYRPALSREEVQDSLLERLTNGIFSGASGRLVMQLLGQQKLHKEELHQIQELLNRMEEE